MKKNIALLLALLLCAALTACGSTEDADEAAYHGEEMQLVEQGKLILATESTLPPYEMPAEAGADVAGTGLRGIDIEVAAELAQRLGLELVVEDMNYDVALLSIPNKRADIVMGAVNDSPELERYMSFSKKYVEAKQVVLVPENSEIEEPGDIKEYKFAVARNTMAWIFAMDHFDPDSFLVAESNAEAIAAMQKGKVDAVVLDEAPAKQLQKANPDLKILEHSYAEENFFIGMAEDNPGLQHEINQALKEMKADGTLKQILSRYVTVDAV